MKSFLNAKWDKEKFFALYPSPKRGGLRRVSKFFFIPFCASLVLVFSVLVLPKSSLAVGEIQDYSSDFNIEMIPDEPRPGERVSAKIISYQFDVDRSEITWTLSGKIIASGMGKKSAEFAAPGFGKTGNLMVDITTNEGIKTSKKKIFNGNDIDFLWESLTTVPAGYKGKALPTYKTVVKITALPHLFLSGASAPASSLVYDWTLNYKKLPDSSGLNKKTFFLKLSDFGEYVVGLTASTKDKRASFQKYFRVSAENAEPMVILYDDNPMEGPNYGKALDNSEELKTSNLTIRAEPYYFSGNVDGRGLEYEWKMNNKKISAGKKPNIVSLVAGEGSGSADISLKINNTGENMFQSAEKFMKIKF